jgi:flagellar biogenesis protein FliO
VFIIVVGFIVILYANDLMNVISQMTTGYMGSSSNPMTLMFGKLPWVIMFIGIITSIYGVKRLVEDIAKLFRKKE